MNRNGNIWALVLAAGEGSRLRKLTTTDSGTSIPKQFCSLHGGPSLFQNALRRGEAIASRGHLCTIVAAQHRNWWREVLTHLPMANVIEQPRNLGTAIGILLPLLHIVERDPQARIVLLPSDHHVEDEPVLAGSLRRALSRLATYPDEVILLGIEPEEPDTELGYIMPGQGEVHGGLNIETFIEKPDSRTAQRLLDEGALWNAFIIVARAQALLDLYTRRYPEIVHEMRALVSTQRSQAKIDMNLVDLYQRLPELDFSRHILQGQEAQLCVVPVPHCGWTDLGTPKRVGEALRKVSGKARVTELHAHLNLAAQHERLQLELRAAS